MTLKAWHIEQTLQWKSSIWAILVSLVIRDLKKFLALSLRTKAEISSSNLYYMQHEVWVLKYESGWFPMDYEPNEIIKSCWCWWRFVFCRSPCTVIAIKSLEQLSAKAHQAAKLLIACFDVLHSLPEELQGTEYWLETRIRSSRKDFYGIHGGECLSQKMIDAVMLVTGALRHSGLSKGQLEALLHSSVKSRISHDTDFLYAMITCYTLSEAYKELCSNCV